MNAYNIIKKVDNYYYKCLLSLNYIEKIDGDKWRVFSEEGKNMGTFDSKIKAKTRLKQIEYFKHKDSNSIEDKVCIDLSHSDSLSYSAVMRELKKENDLSAMKDFLKIFKSCFDLLLINKVENPEETALPIVLVSLSKLYHIKLPKQDDDTAADVVDNMRTSIINSNLPSDMKSLAPFLDPNRQFPYNPIYNDSYQQSPTRENYNDTIRDISPEDNIPMVGTYDNVSEMNGAGVINNGSGFYNP